jgi:hypothetical protein
MNARHFVKLPLSRRWKIAKFKTIPGPRKLLLFLFLFFPDFFSCLWETSHPEKLKTVRIFSHMAGASRGHERSSERSRVICHCHLHFVRLQDKGGDKGEGRRRTELLGLKG